MNTPAMLWFVMWRSVLLGLGLGAGLSTVYGLLVGSLTFPYGVGFFIVGPLFGMVGGLFLGAVGGVTLCVVTLILRRYGVPSEADRSRRIAGRACAKMCVIALALFFEVTARMSGTSFVSGPSYRGEDVVELLIVIVGPSLVATGAAWWTGRKVIRQLAHAVGSDIAFTPGGDQVISASGDDHTVRIWPVEKGTP